VNIGEPKSDENSFQVSPSILARLAERPRARMGMTPCLLFGSLILDFFIFFSFFLRLLYKNSDFSRLPVCNLLPSCARNLRQKKKRCEESAGKTKD